MRAAYVSIGAAREGAGASGESNCSRARRGKDVLKIEVCPRYAASPFDARVRHLPGAAALMPAPILPGGWPTSASPPESLSFGARGPAGQSGRARAISKFIQSRAAEIKKVDIGAIKAEGAGEIKSAGGRDAAFREFLASRKAARTSAGCRGVACALITRPADSTVFSRAIGGDSFFAPRTI